MSDDLFPTLRDMGEFQVWHSVLLSVLNKPDCKTVTQAMREADTVITGLRKRVPALIAANMKLNS